jgi:hypothetical protein
MDIALWQEIQSAIDYGYAAAAEVLGAPHLIYRAPDATAPVVPGNLVATLPAVMLSSPNRAVKPNLYGSPVWFPQIDPTQVRGSDYLVGPGGTYFMHPQQALLPPSCVACNATVSGFRPSNVNTTTGFGPQPPSGDEKAQELPLFTAWPCSLLEGTKGDRGDANLPDDIKLPWFKILLPAIPGVMLRASDVLLDLENRRMVISGAELTDLGWRLAVALESA